MSQNAQKTSHLKKTSRLYLSRLSKFDCRPNFPSAGNFLTLNQGLKRFGADAVRMAMADAGDAIDDANFQSPVANSAILRITKELAWIQEVLQVSPPTLKPRLAGGK
jgi:hypothetical protein